VAHFILQDHAQSAVREKMYLRNQLKMQELIDRVLLY
jgi:hypothetical protein